MQLRARLRGTSRSLPGTSSVLRRVLLPPALSASALAAPSAPAPAATNAHGAFRDSYAAGVGAGRPAAPAGAPGGRTARGPTTYARVIRRRL